MIVMMMPLPLPNHLLTPKSQIIAVLFSLQSNQLWRGTRNLHQTKWQHRSRRYPSVALRCDAARGLLSTGRHSSCRVGGTATILPRQHKRSQSRGFCHRINPNVRTIPFGPKSTNSFVGLDEGAGRPAADAHFRGVRGPGWTASDRSNR